VIGVVGALVTIAVVLAIVLVLAVRPPARRLARAAAALRGDVDTRLGRLRALRRARPRRATPSGAAVSPSSIGGRARHRRPDPAP
jgi:hypothetical protein